jgi:hypothetical protein
MAQSLHGVRMYGEYKKSKSYNDFIATVSIDHIKLYGPIFGWRYGQTFFNMLRREKLELAESIRTTKLDPYYLETISEENHKELENLWDNHNDTR